MGSLGRYLQRAVGGNTQAGMCMGTDRAKERWLEHVQRPRSWRRLSREHHRHLSTVSAGSPPAMSNSQLDMA